MGTTGSEESSRAVSMACPYNGYIFLISYHIWDFSSHPGVPVMKSHAASDYAAVMAWVWA